MKTIQGKFSRADGTPAVNGVLSFLLSQDAVNPSVGFVEHTLLQITLDNTGAIPAGTQIFANDELLPATTWYHLTLNDGENGIVYDEHIFITGDSPINLNLIPPTVRL